MKIPVFIAAIGLAAALVVPVASGRSLPYKVKTGGAKVTKVTKATKVAKPSGQKAKLSVQSVSIAAAPLGGAIMPDPSVADCNSYGGNCTTLEYCEIWGENCPSMVPDSSTLPTEGTPANP